MCRRAVEYLHQGIKTSTAPGETVLVMGAGPDWTYPKRPWAKRVGTRVLPLLSDCILRAT